MFERRYVHLLISALFAMLLVLLATLAFLARGLPGEVLKPLQHPSLKFSFVFGSGKHSEDHMVIDKFANGYALLTSGPVSIKASSFRVLRFRWLPADPKKEAAFFWRRGDDAENLFRTDITLPGFNLRDLATEPDWHDEIIEFGFLIAGEEGETVEIGRVSLESDSIENRLQLTWRAWTAFVEWSQRSINFQHGGEEHQLVSLPVLLTAWLIVTLFLWWLLSVFDKKTNLKQITVAASLLFLTAWILLDIRWISNNLQQMQRSLQSQWRADDHQRLSMGQDGEIYQYFQKFKMSLAGDEARRILIIGEEDVDGYYMLRTKYHLLPHNVDIADRFTRHAKPKSLDYVLFFGQPGEITTVSGWNQKWQQALTEVERRNWGVVYRVNGVH